VVLILGVFVSNAIAMLIYIFMFYTVSCKGLFNSISCIIDFFSGVCIPIVMMPEALQKIIKYLPFRLFADTPFRIYIGMITIYEGISTIFLQLLWIVVLILIGNILMKKVSSKVCIQGG
jgi:ABC-2 type transport system permease protein